MTSPAIRIDGLGKRYSLNARRVAGQTLREAIYGAASAPYRWLRGSGAEARGKDSHWALRDVSLEVAEGTVLGIVGRNGAGKSTLLKILARITYPTVGTAEIAGRVGSLLEVGTGFHQELTGRENVFLNGAILGMTRREIGAKLERIVEFSGVSRFLDTPLKFYSTGMYLRLAFSVAAHMETDILLVDEVLAVGDAEFQKKCLDRMRELAGQGRTVVFVSHNLPAVVHLCEKGAVLDQGRIVHYGPIEEALARYGEMMDPETADDEGEDGRGVLVGQLKLDVVKEPLTPGDPWPLRFRVRVAEPHRHVLLQLGVTTFDGKSLAADMIDSNAWPALRDRGSYLVRVKVPPLWLQPQTYSLRIKVYADRDLEHTARSYSEWLTLHVESASNHDVRGSSPLTPACEWTVERAGGSSR